MNFCVFEHENSMTVESSLGEERDIGPEEFEALSHSKAVGATEESCIEAEAQ